MKMEKHKLPFNTVVAESKLNIAIKGVEKVLDCILPGWSEDPSTERTAERFVKYLAEYRQPIDYDSIFHTFEIPVQHYDGIVAQSGIPFRMICEHHLLPATGKASIAYIPRNRVIGLSKLSRLVDAVGVERPSLQENIAQRIMNLLEVHLQPLGILVVISAEHSCMACRGVTKPDVNTVTSNISGIFRDSPNIRQEAYELLKLSNS